MRALGEAAARGVAEAPVAEEALGAEALAARGGRMCGAPGNLGHGLCMLCLFPWDLEFDLGMKTKATTTTTAPALAA